MNDDFLMKVESHHMKFTSAEYMIIVESTCNKATIYMGLAELLALARRPIDCHLLESAIAFQIHSNSISLYLCIHSHLIVTNLYI